MNPDGTDQRRVTVDPARDEQPAWSPDGTRLAFTRLECCDIKIYTVAIDGSGMTAVTSGAHSDYDPDWQPLPGPRQEDFKKSAQFCKRERDLLGDQPFRERYGGRANAYGKCVSSS
jgi:hypothetical protein